MTTFAPSKQQLLWSEHFSHPTGKERTSTVSGSGCLQQADVVLLPKEGRKAGKNCLFPTNRDIKLNVRLFMITLNNWPGPGWLFFCPEYCWLFVFSHGLHPRCNGEKHFPKKEQAERSAITEDQTYSSVPLSRVRRSTSLTGISFGVCKQNKSRAFITFYDLLPLPGYPTSFGGTQFDPLHGCWSKGPKQDQ